jgi:spore germination protein YaaH
MIIMGYDYHFQGSYVTGPVAPLFGAGTVSEYDIQTAVEKALTMMPAEKIILGVPLYGYEWETIGNDPRSPVIPGTGLIASSLRVSQLVASCSTCSVKLDPVAEEKYLIYKDTDTGSYHQIFYPDQEVMKDKIEFVQKYNLGGIALWALGYEDSTILDPLKNY